MPAAFRTAHFRNRNSSVGADAAASNFSFPPSPLSLARYATAFSGTIGAAPAKNHASVRRSAAQSILAVIRAPSGALSVAAPPRSAAAA